MKRSGGLLETAPSHPLPACMHSNVSGGLASVGGNDSRAQHYESKDKGGGGQLERD